MPPDTLTPREKICARVDNVHPVTFYDNRGNRILKNLDGQRTTSSYDAANQLAWSQDASGRTTYTFDADGNQQVVLSPSGDRVTNLWDYENKLVGVQHPAGSRETMAYDPDGKRVMLQESASTTKYVWDNQNYLQETNASDVTQVTYTNEPRTYGNLISQRKAGASHYYLFDALGSTRLLTDASENISESLLYDAWGNLIGSAPTLAVPFRWVGELGYLFVSVTSDYSVRARVYQPGIGRWISRDPLGFADGVNLFINSGNSVISLIDPSGLRCVRCKCWETYSYSPGVGMPAVESRSEVWIKDQCKRRSIEECCEALCRQRSFGTHDDSGWDGEHEVVDDNACPDFFASLFPEPGMMWTNARPNEKNLCGFSCGYFENPPSKETWLTENPELGPLPIPRPITDAVSGEHRRIGMPPGRSVGVGGCGPCVGVVIRCPEGFAIFHFSAVDDPWRTLRSELWIGCDAVICGGDGDRESLCLQNDVQYTMRHLDGLQVIATLPGRGCGFNMDGTIYDSDL